MNDALAQDQPKKIDFFNARAAADACDVVTSRSNARASRHCVNEGMPLQIEVIARSDALILRTPHNSHITVDLRGKPVVDAWKMLENANLVSRAYPIEPILRF